MASITPVVIVSAAQIASGNSGIQQSPKDQTPSVLTVGINVTAVSGTGPSLAISVEWSHDGGVTWLQGDTPDAFSAIAAVGAKVKPFNVKAPNYRIVWSLSGTSPSFTFAVTADSPA
jgi:hypothetical protein